ncbi:hypothetical protein BDV30DRAFT_136468 [Aspergillus minisclerotigenes]|uniref:Uncharacterized protein n=1 Tax=Aspergillus minisclerotigenes TaxID=656917 RepID=A0A5N6J2L2_9EURO|nr:hypothetical protein BDV30DRAFT_136468 [Aspergillus minisclerotigenes]
MFVHRTDITSRMLKAQTPRNLCMFPHLCPFGRCDGTCTRMVTPHIQYCLNVLTISSFFFFSLLFFSFFSLTSFLLLSYRN